jgi:hypothetical protein
MQEIYQVFDLVRLKNISEGRHSRAAIMDLMFDLLFLQALSYSTQIRPEIPTAAIHTVAVLTPLLVKERRARVFVAVRGSMDDLNRRTPQKVERTRDENKQAKSCKGSHR